MTSTDYWQFIDKLQTAIEDTQHARRIEGASIGTEML